MQRNATLTTLVLLDTFFLGAFPTYLVAHLFAFQRVPGPEVAFSGVHALLQGIIYLFIYPLELWAPWLIYPGVVPALTLILLLILFFRIQRGGSNAALLFLLTVAGNQALELLGAGLIVSTMFTTSLINADGMDRQDLVAAYLFLVRVLLALLIVFANWRILSSAHEVRLNAA